MRRVIQKKRGNKYSGFTLIELTIAIAFISILLLTISAVMTDVISTYRKGVAMKSVNTTGLDLISELTSSISQSPAINFSNLCEVYRNNTDMYVEDAFDQCTKNNGYNFIFQEYLSDIYINGQKKRLPVFGAFCSGKNSYIWNTGYTMNSETYRGENGVAIPKSELHYKYKDSEYSLSDFRLLKFSDPTHALCAAHITGQDRENDYAYSDNDTVFDITDISLLNEPTELLSSKQGGLALYSLTIFSPEQDPFSNRLFYSASMVLGTINGGIDLLAPIDNCTVPDNYKSDYNYCAVNKFNFAMRATGE